MAWTIEQVSHRMFTQVAFRAGAGGAAPQPELEIPQFGAEAGSQLRQDGPRDAGKPPFLLADLRRLSAQDPIWARVVDGDIDGVGVNVFYGLPVGARSNLLVSVEVRTNGLDAL